MRATPTCHWATRSGKAAESNASKPEDLSTSAGADDRRDRQPRPRDRAARPRRRIDATEVCAGPVSRPAVSAALNRLPPLATTGVGSLPFSQVAAAAEHVVGAYELPFCPQLPRLYGDMVSEWLGTDARRCGWSPDRDRQLPAAWDAFALALTSRPPSHRLVKLQVTGPVTLAVALERAAGRASRGAALVELAEQISVWLAAAATEQSRWLCDELGLRALVIVDEPGLHAAGLVPGHVNVWDPLRQGGVGWGLHVCCRVPWPLIAAARPDVLSFDLVRDGVTAAAVRPLRDLLRRGGRVIWGALEAGESPDPRVALRRIDAAAAALDAGPATTLYDRSLVSATCGTGGHPVEAELAVASALARAVAVVRREPVPAWPATPPARATAGRQDDS
jgi:hypothetical protein